MDDASTTPPDRTLVAAPVAGRVPRRRWLVAGGAAVVVLLALVAAWRLTGGGDLQRLAGAPDATVAARTAQVAIIATVEGVPVVSPFTLSVADGAVDFEAHRARLRRDIPGASVVPLLDRVLPAPVEIVHDGGDSYLRLPTGGDRPWIRLDEQDDAGAGPDIGTPSLTNPAAALGLLRALEGMPEVLGEETVRDQPSTHFRVHVDLDRAADALSGRAEDVARGLRRLRGRNDLPLDVWLDADDRVTRLRYAVEPEIPGLSRITVVTDLELSDFGTAVEIEPPAADEIGRVPAERLRDLDAFTWLRALLER